jgi:hypothetical protein
MPGQIGSARRPTAARLPPLLLGGDIDMSTDDETYEDMPLEMEIASTGAAADSAEYN